MITDLANIGYTVETSGLQKGEVALDKFGKANEKAGSTAKKVEAGSKAVSAATAGLSGAVLSATGKVKDYDTVQRTLGDRLLGMKSKSETAALGTDKLGSAMSLAGGAAAKLAATLGTLAGTLLSGAFFASAAAEAENFETIMFRVEAVIKATNGVAGRSADQLREQARALAWNTLESTEGILKAQQTLLTFRNVQGDVFDRAIVAAADMTSALGGDLNSATMQLAKALENPVQGLSALSRSGTVFTAQQKEMVKEMVAAGRTIEAQTFILSELEAQYGGTAAAAAAGAAGVRDTYGQALQELKLEVAETMGLLEAKNSVLRGMTVVFKALTAAVEPMRGYVIAAALSLTAYYSPAILAATVQTYALISSLITLRGALIATGFGAIIAAAGTLINIFIKLIEKTGGVGSAFVALGELAQAVWKAMVASSAAIPPGLQATWSAVKADFMTLLGSLAEMWGNFLGQIADDLGSSINLFEFGGVKWEIDNPLEKPLREAKASAESFQRDMATRTAATREDVQHQYGEMSEIISGAFEGVREKWESLSDVTEDNADGVVDLTTVLNEAGEAAEGAGGKAEKAGKKGKEAAEKAAKAAHEWASALEQELTSAIDSVSKAFGDWTVRGFQDFKSFTKSILDAFKSMLSNMIAMAAKNRIMISMGMDPLSKSLGAAGVGGLPGANTGFIGTALGSFGAPAAGGLLGGLGGVASGVGAGWAAGGVSGAVSGGLGASMAGISGGLAAGGVAGITAALGAAVPIIAGVAAVFKLGKAMFGRKLKDTGIDTTFDMAEGIAARTYKFYKGGWFRSNKTSYSDMDSKLADPLESAFRTIGKSVQGFAKDLGLNAERVNKVRARVAFSTKGMSEEDIQKRFEEEFEKYGNAAARAVSGFKVGRFQREGETSLQTLERLSTSLVAFNTNMGQLGLSLQRVGLAGGQAASKFIDLFGGIENFTAAASYYYDNFYSLQERYDNAQKSFGKTLAEMGIKTVPKTEAQFRSLMERLDKMGRTEDMAGLMQLAPAFIDMLRAAEQLKDGTVELTDAQRERIDLERRLLQASGDTAGLRKMELADTHRSNRALLKQIWAAEKAAKVNDERLGLETQMLQLMGNTAQLRHRELQGLDKSNRALQRWIWAIEDAKEAVSTAEGAARQSADAERQRIDSLRDSAAAMRSIAGEAMGRATEASEAQRQAAERQLRVALETGKVWDDSLNDMAQRAADLDAQNFRSYADFLAASGRAAALISAVADRQEEEAQTAEQRLEAALAKYGLSEATVLSLDEALRNLDRAILALAQAQAGANSNAPRLNQPGGINPALTAPQTSQQQREQQQQVAAMEGLQGEIRQLREDNNVGNAQLAKNTKQVADMQRLWEANGMPPARVLI